MVIVLGQMDKPLSSSSFPQVSWYLPHPGLFKAPEAAVNEMDRVPFVTRAGARGGRSGEEGTPAAGLELVWGPGRLGTLTSATSTHGLPLSLQEVLGPYGTFWLASAFCIASVLFTLSCVPETKGKTLEQITAHFEGR